MSRRREIIEAGIQAEADGSFVVRPFSFFSSIYALPDQNAKEYYARKRNSLEIKITCISTIFLIMLFIDVIFYQKLLDLVFNIIPTGYGAIFGTIIFIFDRLISNFFVWRILRAVGARRIPRSRWRGTNPGNPFSSVKSAQLGGLFILLVALSALLTSILIVSYFGSRSDHGGMPYILMMSIVALFALLAMTFWLVLRKRDRRQGGE